MDNYNYIEELTHLETELGTLFNGVESILQNQNIGREILGAPESVNTKLEEAGNLITAFDPNPVGLESEQGEIYLNITQQKINNTAKGFETYSEAIREAFESDEAEMKPDKSQIGSYLTTDQILNYYIEKEIAPDLGTTPRFEDHYENDLEEVLGIKEEELVKKAILEKYQSALREYEQDVEETLEHAEEQGLDIEVHEVEENPLEEVL